MAKKTAEEEEVVTAIGAPVGDFRDVLGNIIDTQNDPDAARKLEEAEAAREAAAKEQKKA